MCTSTQIIPNGVSICNAEQTTLKNHLLIKVASRSMEPVICHGDLAVLHRCTINDIQFGEIYAVEFDNFQTIRKIYKGDNPDTLTFAPINDKEFDSQIFPVSRIISIYKVVGDLRLF